MTTTTSPNLALHNAEIIAREKVDLAIELQTDTGIASRISECFRAKSIPARSRWIYPIHKPSTTGANNSQAGVIAGRHLARWAEAHWQGNVDELLLLEEPKAGQVPNARIVGSVLGVIERMVWLAANQVKILRTNGHFESALALTRNYLRRTRSERIIVAAINDPCALGALQAFREADREEHCAIVGHNVSPDVYAEALEKGFALDRLSWLFS